MPSLIHQLPTTTMCDAAQEELFRLVGSDRSPFRGIAKWPWLSELIRVSDGESAWKAAGGKFDRVGEPTLNLQSDTVEEILQHVEATTGGLLWKDRCGDAYAIKLETAFHNGRLSRFAYGISWWQKPPEGLDPAMRDYALNRAQEIWDSSNERHRQLLTQLAEDVRLYCRAEQLLWLIHAQVLAQRRSLIFIPEIVMGEVVWGDRSRWPEEWKRDLGQSLHWLTAMHSHVMEHRKGWTAAPKNWAHSVALAHLSHVDKRSNEYQCPPECPLHRESRHDHYRIQIGYGFLGVLEKYLVQEATIEWPADVRGETTLRYYDFTKSPQKEDAKEAIQRSQKAGQLIRIDPAMKICGPGRWSGLQARERQILSGLQRELTRTAKAKTPWEIRDARVVGTRPDQTVVCPFLDPGKMYVVFGGGGKRRGCGYQIVGSKWTGWLLKCGFAAGGASLKKLRPMGRDWLAGFAGLSRFGFVATGLDSKSGEWYSLTRMQDLARTIRGWRVLERLQIRVYAPADLTDQLREFLIHQAGHEPERSEAEHPGVRFGAKMAKLGLTHQDLADQLGTSRVYITKLINGAKWPASRVHQTEAWLADRRLAISEMDFQ